MDATSIGIIIGILGVLAAVLQLFIGNIRDYRGSKKQEPIDPESETLSTLDRSVRASSVVPALKEKVMILPRRPRPFVNREQEIKRVEAALKSFSVVQLRALGGLGKTVLAIEVAYRLKDYFPDGIVHISSIDYPTLEDILNAMANAFDIPVGQTPLREKKVVIQKSFQSKRLLLIFDNVELFEPVESVMDILPTCAVLLTSRPPHLIPNATHIELGQLPQNHAVKLFELNSGQNLSSAERKTVEGICTSLGGFPLAIELAARRIQTSKGDINSLARRIDKASSLEILETKYAGDRSVRASFLSTYRYLSDSDQELFACLGTFGGSSFSLEAIKEVAEKDQTEEGLERLVALALVRRDNNRYSLHPLLKLFARENLRSEDCYKRMARYFSEYASANSEDFAALETERVNIQEAINWSFNHGEKEVVIRTVQALLGDERDFNFLTQCGHWNDALIRIQQAMEASLDLNNADAEGRFLLAHGLFQYWFCNYDEARAAYRKAQQKFAGTGNEAGLVRVYWQRGYIEDDEDNCTKAEELYRKALDLSLKIDDKRLISVSKELVGVVLYHRGKYEEARAELQASLQESVSRGDNAAIARAKRRLAGVARKLAAIRLPPLSAKYVEEARSLLTASIALERNQWGIARLLRQFGLLEQFLHNDSKAKDYFNRSLDIFKTLGTKKGIAAALYNLGTILETEGKLDMAEKNYLESMAIAREINRRSGIGLNLIQLSSLSYRRGDLHSSLEFATQAVNILTQVESLHLESAQTLLDKIRANSVKKEDPGE
jgi:tetratricopeptide (TPR) repeat protein